MNIEDFRESLDFISYSGITIGLESAFLIENSLCILQNENKFKNVFFWGLIKGVEKDYYVAFGYVNDCFTQRKFFYSLNCYHWLMLPPPKLDLYEACVLCTERFSGDPSVVTSVKLDPKFSIDEYQIIMATEPVIQKITEEDRLSCLVYVITEESALVPRSGLYKMVDGNVFFNPTFGGLDDLEAVDLKNYQLYREPRNKFNYNLLKRNDYNYPIDFLDTVDDIIPEEYAFVLNFEKCGSIVLIKSRIWPGMTFFHKINSNKHGFIYYGCGRKNFDLLFGI